MELFGQNTPCRLADVDIVLVARRKTIIHTEAERHTVIYQAPCVLRLLLKRFM